VRQQLGGFVPANGVGTGFERSAVEDLRRSHNGRFFDPDCLTEDYENGFRMHAAGYRQIFVPIHFDAGEPVATREYFPRNWRAAVRQRSRWVAGITLQGWQRHGWRVPARQKYWFWRDRKGLAGNLLSPLANLLLVCWLGTLALPAGNAFRLPGCLLPPALIPAFLITTCISVLQTAVRVHLSAGLYGWRFAAATPLRVFWGNLINFAATAEAVRDFLAARVRRHELVWRKTEHIYPGDPVHIHPRPRLGEVLVQLRFISAVELEEALRQKAPGQRIGEYLVEKQKITRDHLYRALGSQSGRPVEAWAAEFSEGEDNQSAESRLPEYVPHPGAPV
jgi:adsorption protein B